MGNWRVFQLIIYKKLLGGATGKTWSFDDRLPTLGIIGTHLVRTQNLERKK